jgi:acetylornithine/N-succinyldiaminopimelate aminotransferase
VQGEGGRASWPEGELKAIRDLCDETGTLLIYDEIQCGSGGPGKALRLEWAEGAQPDIMAVAKALGGGFPVGACLATARRPGHDARLPRLHLRRQPAGHGRRRGLVEELVKPELLAHVREVAAISTSSSRA